MLVEYLWEACIAKPPSKSILVLRRCTETRNMQVERVASAYEACALHDAAEGAMAVAVRANKFVDDAAPWTAFKKVSTLCASCLCLCRS